MSDQQTPKTTQGSTSVATAPSNAAVLCLGGCGFYGNARTNNYCSKCFKSQVPASPSTTPMAEKKVDSTPTSQPSTSTSTSASSPSPAFLPLPPPSVPVPPMTSSSSSSSSLSPSPSPSPSPSLGPSTPSASPLSTPSSSPSIGPMSSPGEEAKKKKTPRCATCNVKVGLNYFQCKCSEVNLFCSSHRHPFEHRCTYDHRAQQRDIVRGANPTVKGDKLADRL